KLTYEVAAKGIVLIKKKFGILPIDKPAIGTLAIIGPNAAYTRTGGGGSSLVAPYYNISPLEGITNKYGKLIDIKYAPGLILDGDAPVIEPKYFYLDKEGTKNGVYVKYFANKNMQGTPKLEQVENSINNFWSNNSPILDFNNENFSIVYEGYLKFPKSGTTVVNLTSDDGSRLYIEDELVIDDWNDHGMETKSFTFEVEKDKLYKYKIEYYENMGDAGIKLGWQLPDNDLLKQAIETAKNCDLAIVFVGTTAHYETEGKDRDDLILPNNQDELINKILEANKNVIVVITSGSPILMDNWIDKVPAVLQTWFAGQELGNAVADILFGDFNPSGKLTITYPNKWEDCSAYDTYKKESGTTEYADGIYVGYRHFDKKGIKPLFPFGHGLSYTTYKYSDLKINENNDKIEVTFNIENTGAFNGKEIAQLYIMPINSKIDRPVKELKGFVKVPLNIKEKKNAKITLEKNAFAYYDMQTNDFKVDKGEYLIQIGSSSQTILLEQKFEIK
ncbi:MAG TPA: glycoside hydrolase family 3 C-terminal domain-containing protein, partial [Melioribacteraceae bacterium]|nr:glycoside hydrolase family 3 C-terminal domain-containing protein [Melioribacteraceae bacterium]